MSIKDRLDYEKLKKRDKKLRKMTKNQNVYLLVHTESKLTMVIPYPYGEDSSKETIKRFIQYNVPNSLGRFVLSTGLTGLFELNHPKNPYKLAEFNWDNKQMNLYEEAI